MRCPKCNKDNHDESNYCMYCGCNFKEYAKGSFLRVLASVIRWFIGIMFILSGLLYLFNGPASAFMLILCGVLCLPAVTKCIPMFRGRKFVLSCIPIVLIFMSILSMPESEKSTATINDTTQDMQISTAAQKNNYASSAIKQEAETASKAQEKNESIVVATLIQEGDNTDKKPSKIKIYDDGTFEFIYKKGNEERIYHGHYLYGQDVIIPGKLEEFFNCWVDDNEATDNLGFRLSYTLGVEIVTFSTEFNNGEFGDTFAGDVFDMEIHDESKLYQHRGDTYYNDIVDESYNVFSEPYITLGKVFLDGDVRNGIEKYTISDEINYKKDCNRLSVNYDNAARNSDYLRGNMQSYCGKVYACDSDSLLLDTAAGRVVVAFPEGYNPGIMVNDGITVYGILSGVTRDPQTYNNVPYLLAKYIDGNYNAASIDSEIGAELLDLNGKWRECNLFGMSYYDHEYIVIDNTTIFDNETSLVCDYVIQSIEKKRSLYGEDYFEMIIKKTFEDGSGGALKANFYYLSDRLEFGSMQSFYKKVE